MSTSKHVVLLFYLPKNSRHQQEKEEAAAEEQKELVKIGEDPAGSWIGLQPETRRKLQINFGGNKHSYLRGKRDKKLLQIQLGILRERNLNPQRWLEVIHVNVERCYRHVVVRVVAELIIVLRESLSERRAVDVAGEDFLLGLVECPYRDVHLGGYAARDGEISVDVSLHRRIAKIDLRVVPVLLLRQIESELIVNREIIVARVLLRIAVVNGWWRRTSRSDRPPGLSCCRSTCRNRDCSWLPDCYTRTSDKSRR